MVEVFKTNVSCPHLANELVELLLVCFPGGRINFDLEDCDRVLRIEKEAVIPEQVIALLGSLGVGCALLE